MRKLKSKRLIILGVIIIVIILLILVIFLNIKSDKKVVIKKDEATKIYDNIRTGSCTDIPNDNNGVLLNLVFADLKNKDSLSDDINLDDFLNSLESVSGNKKMDYTINDFIYEGYSYTLDGNKISRKKASCPKVSYTSKLYGYTYNNDNLELYIKMGYIDNGKVYDLSNKEIGEYDKKTINKILDDGTLQIYSYQIDNNKYYFKKIIEG